MKTRSGYTSILTAFALSGAVLVSGCTSSGQGYTDEATQVTQRPYANVKIRQRGRVSLQHEEFAQAAARNALDALTKAGIPEASLISAEIYGISPRSRSLSRGGRSRPAFYEVWVRVAECPSRVFFKAQAAGTIFEMNDKADCVAMAKEADTSAS
jgi:hypothetical protein